MTDHDWASLLEGAPETERSTILVVWADALEEGGQEGRAAGLRWIAAHGYFPLLWWADIPHEYAWEPLDGREGPPKIPHEVLSRIPMTEPYAYYRVFTGLLAALMALCQAYSEVSRDRLPVG